MDEAFLNFIAEHHVMSISACDRGEIWTASCFYAFNKEELKFVFTSDKNTRHMKLIEQNPLISGAIHLETKKIGLVRGLQFSGTVKKADKADERAYFAAFAFARVFKPKLWSVRIEFAKLTDNRLGFGKKLIWERDKKSE